MLLSRNFRQIEANEGGCRTERNRKAIKICFICVASFCCRHSFIVSKPRAHIENCRQCFELCLEYLTAQRVGNNASSGFSSSRRNVFACRMCLWRLEAIGNDDWDRGNFQFSKQLSFVIPDYAGDNFRLSRSASEVEIIRNSLFACLFRQSLQPRVKEFLRFVASQMANLFSFHLSAEAIKFSARLTCCVRQKEVS